MARHEPPKALRASLRLFDLPRDYAWTKAGIGHFTIWARFSDEPPKLVTLVWEEEAAEAICHALNEALIHLRNANDVYAETRKRTARP